MNPQPLDWPGLLRAGLHGLGLLPKDFWRLTPIELAVMLGRDPMAPGLTRAGLGALIARFPDAPRAEKAKDLGDGSR